MKICLNFSQNSQKHGTPKCSEPKTLSRGGSPALKQLMIPPKTVSSDESLLYTSVKMAKKSLNTNATTTSNISITSPMNSARKVGSFTKNFPQLLK